MCTGPGRWCGALCSSEGELGSWREPREPVAPGSLAKDAPAVGDTGVPPPLESRQPRCAPSLEKASSHGPRRTIPAAAGKGVPPYLCGEQPGQVDLRQDFLPVALPVGLLVFHGLIRGENLVRYRTRVQSAPLWKGRTEFSFKYRISTAYNIQLKSSYCVIRTPLHGSKKRDSQHAVFLTLAAPALSPASPQPAKGNKAIHLAPVRRQGSSQSNARGGRGSSFAQMWRKHKSHQPVFLPQPSYTQKYIFPWPRQFITAL